MEVQAVGRSSGKAGSKGIPRLKLCIDSTTSTRLLKPSHAAKLHRIAHPAFLQLEMRPGNPMRPDDRL